MRFLSPLALFGLALIALPIAIHLLVRRRATRLDFPSLKFLRETPSFRLRPRRIQQPLLLALRVAAIALLVIGLSSPLISFATKTSRMRIILLDASLSMRARGRTEAAKEQARSLINNLGVGERTAIIAFAGDSFVLSSMTSDKRELRDAIDRYQPTNETADYAAGFRAAGALLQRELDGETSIDLVSDFQRSGLHRDLVQVFNRSIGRAQVITHPVGAELERNALLIDEDVMSGESGSGISASELVIARDERSTTRKSWTLDSKEGSRADIEWRTQPNGQITARMRSLTPDDFDADDSTFLAFALPRVVRALLIEGETDEAVPYLRAALEATVSELGEKRFMLEHKASLPTSSSELRSYSLVALVLHGKPRPDEMRILSDYAHAGGRVWLCMGSDVDTAEWNQLAGTEGGRSLPFTRVERKDDKVQATGFGSVDAAAPALRSMNEQLLNGLRAVAIRQGFAVTPRVDSITMMRWNDNTAAFVGAAVGGGNVLLLATSPARTDGDLGTSATFPALASSIVRLSTTPSEPLALEIGQSVNLGLAPNATVSVLDAKGKATTTQARDLVASPAVYFPEPGIYRVDSDSFTKYLAVNTPNAESESGLAPADEIERVFKLQSTTPVKHNNGWYESAERIGNAWRYFLVAAFVFLITEMFIAIKQREKGGQKLEG